MKWYEGEEDVTEIPWIINTFEMPLWEGLYYEHRFLAREYIDFDKWDEAGVVKAERSARIAKQIRDYVRGGEPTAEILKLAADDAEAARHRLRAG